eukprot:TRINITY_DN88151_c0_g1_i1.p1 TRINITY_DN88151_c0_g1~~TRINITY_DN88151_c0_g1_i1.p1  ORF type:complete len:202 (+),score=34.29 TRINITY_DN88151_c0_g1_i1:52-606(+)
MDYRIGAVELEEADGFEDDEVNVGSGIDLERQRFPYCIVWQPLPVITWICPIIGHLGMAGGDGQIWDFSGAPFGDGTGRMMCGDVVRYLQLNPRNCRKLRLNLAVQESNQIYRDRMHNICCDNCHSHVAVALEKAEYKGRQRWNMVIIAFWVFFQGRYTNAIAVVKHWLPFLILVGFITLQNAT